LIGRRKIMPNLEVGDKVILGEGLELRLFKDSTASNPREMGDMLGIMATWHGRYKIGDVQPEQTPQEFEAWLKDPENHVVCYLPLYMYDHSTQSISTKSFIGRAQHAEWDSGQVGWIYTTWDKVKELGVLASQVEEQLEAEVEEYNQWNRGENWGWELIKIESCPRCHNTEEEQVAVEGGLFGKVSDYSLVDAVEAQYTLNSKQKAALVWATKG
jgi:hypothetical protein